MTRTQQIETRLREALAPRELNIHDDSESHRGHGGYQEGGESHFKLMIRSEAFAGKSRVNRERMVHKALGPELVSAIHALSMDLDT